MARADPPSTRPEPPPPREMRAKKASLSSSSTAAASICDDVPSVADASACVAALRALRFFGAAYVKCTR
jgi:hypothetical protein